MIGFLKRKSKDKDPMNHLNIAHSCNLFERLFWNATMNSIDCLSWMEISGDK